MIQSRIVSCGMYLPKKAVTNSDLEKIVDTSDEWIKQRTGIEQRYIADDTEPTSFMATQAALSAMKKLNLAGTDIDAIVLATTSPDSTFPATAVTVQDNIGMADHGFAFDVQAVCSGFMYALSVADNFIKAGQVKRVLVIGAERFSNLLDWDDRTTCVLFGDGAGAVILEASEETDKGILSTHLHSEGAQRGILNTSGGPGTNKQTGFVHMDGKEVFRHAVTRMSEVVNETLEANNITAEDVDWLIPHQANKRIIDGTAKKLKLPIEKVVLTVDKHGNTSAASIPLALCTAVEDGRVKEGDLLLLEALGAGLTWGSALIRW